MADLGGIRSLARRYARGLADAAPKDLAAAAAALDGWRETIRHSPELSTILSDPRHPRPKRADLARELFSKLGAPPALLNLIGLLIDENRFLLVESIHGAFVEEREKREGIQHIVIETPATLADQMRERVRSRMAELLRRHVRIEEQIRPNLIGGINIRIGSRVWYGNAHHRVGQLFRS